MQSDESTTGKIYEKIPAIMADMNAIGKNQVNRTQGKGFKFRGIDDMYNHLQPLLKKHGVFSYPAKIERVINEEITSKNGAKGYHLINEYTFRFCAQDGSHFDAVTMGEAIDYGDKTSNKCAAIAHKYALIQVFAAPTEDLEDPDSKSHDLSSSGRDPKKQSGPAPDPQAKADTKRVEKMIEAFEQLGLNADKLKDTVKVDDLDNLTVDQFEKLSRFYVEYKKQLGNASSSKDATDLSDSFS